MAGHPSQIGGHHNIAWEMSGDRRFDSSYGTIKDVLEEVRYDGRHAILSSEDFTGAIAQHGAFQSFLQAAHTVFSDVCVIVFLRNQIDYAASLYLELLVHGLDIPFDAFLKTIATQPSFLWHEWNFPFDFDRFLSEISAFEGVQVKVRSYESNKSSLLQTFLAACGMTGEPINALVPTFENVRRPAGLSLVTFFKNQQHEPLTALRDRLLGNIEQQWNREPIGMSLYECRLLSERFHASNERVFARTGIPLNEGLAAAERACADRADALAMSRVFSLELLKLFYALSSPVEIEALPDIYSRGARPTEVRKS
jgi:hypothetical protein